MYICQDLPSCPTSCHLVHALAWQTASTKCWTRCACVYLEQVLASNILWHSIIWSFMSILMPIPSIKGCLKQFGWPIFRVYEYCCLGEFNPCSSELTAFLSPRLVVMKQLSHPYTTKRMQAFKSMRIKYIKTS